MKRVVLIGMMIAALTGGSALAQDCEYIVGPKFGYNMAKLRAYPASKLDYHCRFSRNCFFVTDEVPLGATVVEISEVKDNVAQEMLTNTFKVSLDSLSYSRYNLGKWQDMRGTTTVYFSTPNSEYRYLGLRPYKTAMDMTGGPDMSLDKASATRNEEN